MSLLPALLALLMNSGGPGSEQTDNAAWAGVPLRRHVMWLPAVVLLELYGRILGWVDHVTRRRNLYIWPVATTTKAPLAVTLGNERMEPVVWPMAGPLTATARPTGEEGSLPHAE